MPLFEPVNSFWGWIIPCENVKRCIFVWLSTHIRIFLERYKSVCLVALTAYRSYYFIINVGTVKLFQIKYKKNLKSNFLFIFRLVLRLIYTKYIIGFNAPYFYNSSLLYIKVGHSLGSIVRDYRAEGGHVVCVRISFIAGFLGQCVHWALWWLCCVHSVGPVQKWRQMFGFGFMGALLCNLSGFCIDRKISEIIH